MQSPGCRAAVLGLLTMVAPIAVCTIGHTAVAAPPPPVQKPVTVQPSAFPTGIVPESFGVNIHFTDARPGEMAMLAGGGFRWVRMDFAWGATEQTRGRYDFSAYDRLMKDLEAHQIRPVFILDYGNPLYAPHLPDKPESRDWSPATPQARAAMARWAAAAVTHFKGRGIVWEMWNEPNIGFWKPEPSVAAYSALALEVGKAIRAAAPQELYVGPASAGDDLAYLEGCFKAGLLRYWDAVSVHSYRQNAPETVSADYARVRALIAKYAPKGRTIPILSGEWGYSAAWGNYTEAEQGKMLPRQWLVNSMNGIPISIWYDWHDDGTDPKDGEHHFGTVSYPYLNPQTPYAPKPAYLAAQTLARSLRGFRYNKRLWTGSPDDYVLLFTRRISGHIETKLAVWTVARGTRSVTLPVAATIFDTKSMTGHASFTQVKNGNLTIPLTDSPQYFTPRGLDSLLQIAAEWSALPLERVVHAPQQISTATKLRNPLSQPIRAYIKGKTLQTLQPGALIQATNSLSLSRDVQPVYQESTCTVAIGVRRAVFTQKVAVTAQNPLNLLVAPLNKRQLALYISNPSGETTQGSLLMRLQQVQQASTNSPTIGENKPIAIQLTQGTTQQLLPLSDAFSQRQWASNRSSLNVASLTLSSGKQTIASTPYYSFSMGADFTLLKQEHLDANFQVLADGDLKVPSTQQLTLAQGLAVAQDFFTSSANAGKTTVKDNLLQKDSFLQLDYNFAPGWKFARVAPMTSEWQNIPAKAHQLGLWVNGDGSGNLLRLRFTDSTGQTFQPDGGILDWRGWHYVQFPLDGETGGHWGGVGDGIPHAPLRLDTLLLIDSARQQQTSGRILFSAPAFFYN